MTPAGTSSSGACYVWLASYPKSGSTWFRAILWALDHPDPADAEVELEHLGAGPMASDRSLFDLATGLDSGDLPAPVVEDLRSPAHEWLLRRPPVGRLTGGLWVRKTHDAWTRAPSGGPLVPVSASRGAVYLVRNPLDVCVSYGHHQGGADLDSVIDQLNDPADAMAAERDRRCLQLPQHLGGWSNHVTSWLDQDDLPVTVVRYEDLHDPSSAAVVEAVRRCGRAVTDGEVERARERCRFARLAGSEERSGFSERPPLAERFFRRGRIGDWRDHLTAAQVRRVVGEHGEVMARLGYLDEAGDPL